MAMLVDFIKVWEDPGRVEYAFGLSSRMDRRLVIDKSTRRATPMDGEINDPFRMAYYVILNRQEVGGYWPTEGAAAS
ncbi:hypothetical protein [Rhizomonospora bruguierae]|uniref:hypothetical protein n=1 Tax=Rhizomonospora bruguierae TaxID=1581705 RepID=UPI001BD10399|nr:hypothetical protein [Micromonospora sp. NBRC 107566]